MSNCDSNAAWFRSKLAGLAAVAAVAWLAVLPAATRAAPVSTDPGDKVGKMPHLEFNLTRHWVRVECQALAVDAPLEFFCCLNGTNEHESVLRSGVRPSDLHAALLAIGLKPGAPMTYSEATKKWLPPHGPPLRISVEFQKDGKTISYPAYRWLRDLKTKKECQAFSWVFCGSRIMKDGRYAADDTGYIVSIVNFDFVVIDIPEFASSSNDLLEWERNAELMPPKGTTVWMVIQPTGNEAGDSKVKSDPLPAPSQPATQPGADVPTTDPTNQALADIRAVKTDEAKVQEMIQYHDRILGPRARALREAAEAHYEVIESLRKEQQRLITEADLIQRAIDELEKKYQDLTTPQPPDNASATTAPSAQSAGSMTDEWNPLSSNPQPPASRRWTVPASVALTMPSEGSEFCGWALLALLALFVSFCASAICYWQTSLTLGVFLGPLILATVFAPCLVLADNHPRARLSILAAIIIGSTMVWFCVGSHQVITRHQDLDCALVLAAWVLVVSGASLVLREVGLVPNLASTVTIVVSFIWLSWPIWLSAFLPSHERIVSWLCWAHPIMTTNSVVRQLGLWGSPMGGSDLAYRYLTNLNQDVAYPHWQSIWPCVGLHGLVGALLVSTGLLLGRLRQGRSSSSG